MQMLCTGQDADAKAAAAAIDEMSWRPSEGYVSRSIPEPVDEHDNDYNPHLIQGGEQHVCARQYV